MGFTNEEKLEEVKKILVVKIEATDSFEALKTLIGEEAWTKLMVFLEGKLQAEIDRCDVISQAALDRKAKLLALMEETF